MDIRAQLQQAAIAFERATRSHIRADNHHARALRSRRQPGIPTADGLAARC
jgi:hypothetical protein